MRNVQALLLSTRGQLCGTIGRVLFAVEIGLIHCVHFVAGLFRLRMGNPGWPGSQVPRLRHGNQPSHFGILGPFFLMLERHFP
jgi:hypothetical protein